MKVPPFACPLFVSVGLSALTNDRIGLVPPKTNNQTLRDQVADYLADTTTVKAHPESYKTLADDLYEAHRAFWSKPAEFYSGKGPAGRRVQYATSAELWSTYRLARRAPKIPFDGIVLLVSDTTEGRFAARVNERVMKSDEYRGRLNWVRLGVTSEVVSGLDAKVSDTPLILMKLIGEYHPTHQGVRINITGGYKGLAAHIGELSYWKKYHYYYMHESLAEPDVFVRPGFENGVSPTAEDW